MARGDDGDDDEDAMCSSSLSLCILFDDVAIEARGNPIYFDMFISLTLSHTFMTPAMATQRISKKAMSLTATLERLRNGPASIVLPPSLKQVEMTFAKKNRDYGAR